MRISTTAFNSDLDEGIGERFRINLGMGKQVNDRLRADLNYLFHKVCLPDEGSTLEFDDHVLRLRFSYTFD